MDGNQLSLQMRRELCDRKPVCTQCAADLIAIRLTLRGLLQIDKTSRTGGQLQPLIAQTGSPLCNGIEPIERRPVARELCDEDPGSLDGSHLEPPVRGLISILRNRTLSP
jgi:hypothetical protein